MTERQEQITTVTWFRLQYKKYANCLMSIPNGAFLHGNEKQRKRQMSALKAEGLVNGVSDLFLMASRGGYHGLFLEMKDKGKTKSSLSDAQKEHMILAREQGYAARWASGADEAIKIIDEYMKMED